MAKKRIAWFSPDFQEKTFSKGAYVSDLLIPLLISEFEIDLFCDKAGCLIGGLESENFLTANIKDQKNPYDIYLYNFENKSFCNFIRIHLGLKPGIVWFHDYNLLDDGPEPILNSPWSRMLGLFENSSDCRLWPNFKDLFIPSKPAAVRESGLSFFSIFSNERDLTQFAAIQSMRLNPEDKGMFIPMPIPEKAFDIAMNVRPAALALCSGVDVDSHVHSILMALKSLPQIKLNWLIEPTEKLKAEELLFEFGINNYQLFVGKSIDNWLSVIDQSSFSSHLLFSFYDQLQPFLAISMAQSKPCLVLNFGETDHIPDSLVFKIEPGFQEVAQIQLLLLELLQGKLAQDSLDLGVSYVREKHLDQVVASEFLLFFKQIDLKYKDLLSRWQYLEQTALTKVINQSLDGIEDSSHTYFKDKYRELNWL